MRLRMLLSTAVLLLLPGLVHAGNLTFTEYLVADFQFSLLPNTPIYGGSVQTPFIPFQAKGTLTFTLDASLNDPSQPTTVAFTAVSGTLSGDSPSQFLPYTISPDLQFLGGELTNIVRDGSGNVLTADVSDLSMRWSMVGTPGNVTLYTKDGLPFDGTVSFDPASPGMYLAGAADFNVYLQGGGPDPVVIGRDRTLSTPEPSSIILLTAGVVGVGVYIRRRPRA